MKDPKSTRGRIQDLRITVIDYVLWALIAWVVSYVGTVVAGCFIMGVGFAGIMYVASHPLIIVISVVITIVACIPLFYLIRWQAEQRYMMRRLRNAKRGIEGNLENSHFMTLREMSQNGYRIYNNVESLRTAESGILLHLEERKKGRMRIVFSPETIHTLILGTTGSGKTTSYIIPSIKALSITSEATRPSFLFTDPKGELYEKTAWYLQEQGYKVLALDFRHPERSLRWNPLSYAWAKMEEAQRVYENVTMVTAGLEPVYLLNGKEYTAYEIEEATKAEVQRLEDEAHEEIINIVSALCPITSQKDPIWDEGAKGLIQGVVMAMLEDGMSYDDTDMTLDKFNFYNLHQICTHAGAGYKDLIDYFKLREKQSRAVTSAEIVLVAPQTQQGSYMSSVQQKLQLFNDRGICNMTSASEIDVKQMDEAPTAIYLMLPDEKEGRHPLGSLFISQCYKKLVEKAVENGGALKRRVFFMMDEYGNMPKINGVQSMFTVGRSRGIIQMPVIQAYSQIIDKYGAETARTIFGNCNTEIFIGSKDDETCKRFSEKLGNYTVMSSSVSSGKHGVEHNYNESLKERPLMYPRELTLLNNKNDMGNIVVINQGYSPTLGSFTPYFKSSVFPLGDTPAAGRVARALDEEKVYYDFKSRKKQLLEEFDEAMEGGEAQTQEPVNQTNEAEPTPEAKEELVPNEEVETNISELDRIFERFTEIAKKYEISLTANDVEGNIKAFDVVIENLREDMRVSQLNEAVKLREQYLDIINLAENNL